VAGGRVVVDGEPVDAHIAAVPGTPLFHLLLGGASWTIAAQPLGGPAGSRWALGAAGLRYEVTVVDERTRRIQSLTARPADAAAVVIVRAPMPGLVLRVEVAVGETVPAGAGLVVVEAMKMENELRAPRPGQVAAVHVAAGATVERGAPLVTLEPGPSVEASG
jgi:pyruvate carboxylase subunit B